MLDRLADRFGRFVLARRIGRLLNGSYDDLSRLLQLTDEHPAACSLGLLSLLRSIEADLDTQQGSLWVPSFVVISPTMRCTLKCTGCYCSS